MANRAVPGNQHCAVHCSAPQSFESRGLGPRLSPSRGGSWARRGAGCADGSLRCTVQRDIMQEHHSHVRLVSVTVKLRSNPQGMKESNFIAKIGPTRTRHDQTDATATICMRYTHIGLLASRVCTH
eukprot:SAG11_NODE_574_length_8430_cov_11.461769_13_plen_126_part_00